MYIGSGIQQTARRIDSGRRRMVVCLTENLSRNCRGRLWRTQRSSGRRMEGLSSRMGGVSCCFLAPRSFPLVLGFFCGSAISSCHRSLTSATDGYARKIHYTCDLFFALSWGAVTGFHSPFPWFYPFFFTCMIIHRAIRDIQKCRAKYGKAWEEYERQVPYLFIPVSPTICSAKVC